MAKSSPVPVLTKAAVKTMHLKIHDNQWQYYYAPTRIWQAVTSFELNIELDKSLDVLALNSIEYRQYISGGVWVALNNQDWEDSPNGNPKFRIPGYDGQNKCVELPMKRVSAPGLVMGEWKEDGEVKNSKIERYGYRATADLDMPLEADYWHPKTTSVGHLYRLRDRPMIRGRWNDKWSEGKELPLWIYLDLWFWGAVVQVENVGETTRPVRILDQKRWKIEWHNGKLERISQATMLSETPADHDPAELNT